MISALQGRQHRTQVASTDGDLESRAIGVGLGQVEPGVEVSLILFQQSLALVNGLSGVPLERPGKPFVALVQQGLPPEDFRPVHIADRTIRMVLHHLGEDSIGPVQVVSVEKLETLSQLLPQFGMGLEKSLRGGRQTQAQQPCNGDQPSA